HDQKEALSLAGRMAVLRDGVIEQVGDPRTVYRAPANRFVADFIGETNWFSGVVQGASNGEVELKTEAGVLRAASPRTLTDGMRVQVGFRPEAVHIGANDINELRTAIAHVSYLGEIEQYALELAPGRVIKAFEQNPLEIRKIGASLTVHVRPQDVLVLPE